MKAKDIPLGARIKVPFGNGYIPMTLTMRDTDGVPPGRIILWGECSYAYWVDEEEDIYILEMPTPETTAKLFELDELDKEQKKESSNELE